MGPDAKRLEADVKPLVCNIQLIETLKKWSIHWHKHDNGTNCNLNFRVFLRTDNLYWKEASYSQLLQANIWNNWKGFLNNWKEFPSSKSYSWMRPIFFLEYNNSYPSISGIFGNPCRYGKAWCSNPGFSSSQTWLKLNPICIQRLSEAHKKLPIASVGFRMPPDSTGAEMGLVQQACTLKLQVLNLRIMQDPMNTLHECKKKINRECRSLIWLKIQIAGYILQLEETHKPQFLSKKCSLSISFSLLFISLLPSISSTIQESAIHFHNFFFVGEERVKD